MSTIGTTGLSSQQTPKIVDKDKVGFNGLTSETFLKLLITQLQNQDPTNPVGNEELLNQLSTMRNLQANIELSDSLKAFASNQQLTAGAAFLGKSIAGKDADNKEVTGVVDRVFIENTKMMLGIGNDKVPVANVTAVQLAAA